MSVAITWDNDEHSLIRVTFDGQWEAGDLFRIIEEGARMVEGVNHEVDSIFDFTRSSISPPKLLSTLERMEETQSENERLLIIVKANGYLKSLIKVARVLAPKTFRNVHFANNLDTAYKLIQNQQQASPI